jgi:hypothetical protein
LHDAEQTFGHHRYSPMPDNRKKADIEQAIAKLNVRTACTIVDLTSQVLDLLGVQPPVVLEALIDETKRRHVTGPRSRQGVRQALLEYCEGNLQAARERERQLYHGFTGN